MGINKFLIFIFIAYIINVSCKNDKNSNIVFTMEGIYNFSKLKQLIPQANVEDYKEDESISYFLIKIKNLSNQTIYVPCDAKTTPFLYMPSKIIYKRLVSDEMSSIQSIDCYSCNNFKGILPRDSIKLISAISNWERLYSDTLTINYPYCLDTSQHFIRHFKVQKDNVSGKSLNIVDLFNIEEK